MALAPFFRRIGAFLNPRPARWSTVALLAIVLAYADGAVITVIKGATGSIARVQSPFSSWLTDSTVLVPVFLLAVLIAFRISHRRIGSELRSPRRVLAAGLLIGLIGSVAGIAALVASGGYDYYLQSNELQATGPTHDHDAGLPGANGLTGTGAAGTAAPAGAAAGHSHADCEEVCQEIQQTLSGDVQAIGIGGPIILGVNLVLVGWLLAMLGGRLSTTSSETERTDLAAATSSTTVGGLCHADRATQCLWARPEERLRTGAALVRWATPSNHDADESGRNNQYDEVAKHAVRTRQ